MSNAARILGVAAALVLCGCPSQDRSQKKMTKTNRGAVKDPIKKSVRGKAPGPIKKSDRGKVQRPPAKKNDSPKAPWSVDYSDGSGNGFRFWQEAGGGAAQFSYDPVTPAESSSGTYSGGKPKKGTLDTEQVQKLRRLLRRLEGDPSKHAASRMKGTGAFSFKSPDGKGEFVVSSRELGPFEDLIKPFRGR